MSLVVYNTLTRRKESFEPRVAGKVGMYVCGLTVYDYAHIGHARTAVAFETIRRWLKHVGYDVTFVQNVTDVDDKIIKRARELGVDPQEHAATWSQICNDDYDRLGLSPPDVQPKVTAHMDDIVALIKRLVDNGTAYASSDGSVYYAVEKKADYGKLSNRSHEEMMAGARVEPAAGKRNPKDFALWKSSKPDEPAWDSPWGKGRPGWHIECSAMSMKYLGESFDAHGGGVDLVFPHHENEIAQSEAATGKPFAKYWWHTGFLTVNGEKMSKSLHNYVTIQDILKNHEPEVIRFFYAYTHYRSGIDYNQKALEEAKRGLDRLRRLADELSQAASEAEGARSGDQALTQAAAGLVVAFTDAMDDDFNTRAAVAALFDFANAAYKAITDGVGKVAAANARDDFVRLARVLTLLPHEDSRAPDEGFVQRVKALVESRDQARASKDWAKADQIRDELAAMGVEISDAKEGTKWRMVR